MQVLNPQTYTNQTTPATPSTGKVSLYAKNNSIYKIGEDGIEADLASLGTGGAVVKPTVTVGKTGSNADYICTGTNDDVQIQQAIDFAATTGNRKTVQIIGYGADFVYKIASTLILKAGVSIVGTGWGSSTCQLQLAPGVNDDLLRTQNFYNEIFTNYNSYSTIGKIQIKGIQFNGNGVRKTTTYANFASFPSTGQVTNNIYVDRSTDIGYLWTGSAYSFTGIKNSGLHWRAYSNHLVKIYGFMYLMQECTFNNDGGDFCIYSEQTNTDTAVFNNYETMEASLSNIRYVGFGLGGINWYGPHDSTWIDVKGHTNQYATDALYNLYITQTANSNGGGLVWHDVHSWGPTATYGANVYVKGASISGKGWGEGSGNIAFYAENASFPSLELSVTNANSLVVLKDCGRSKINVAVQYLFTGFNSVVKLLGSLSSTVIDVSIVDTTVSNAGAKLYDITGLTSSNLVKLSGLIPYKAAGIILPGITATDLSANSYIDITVEGATAGSLGSRILKPSVVSTDYSQFTGTIFGTTEFNTGTNTYINAWDGNLGTFFDAVDPGSTGIDLGAGNAKILTKLAFASRSTWAARMNGGRFQGSNDGTAYTTFYTIPSTPADNVLTEVVVSSLVAYRYYRYLSPTGGFCNVSVIKFYSGGPLISQSNLDDLKNEIYMTNLINQS
jgi:hypothetical protein